MNSIYRQDTKIEETKIWNAGLLCCHSTTLYVIDTSHLIEIAGEGRDSHPKASKKVRARFAKSSSRGGRFFVPLPCLFELGDHIAGVKHDEKREKLVRWLRLTVEQCLRDQRPWTITPTHRPEEVLPALLGRFEPLAVKQSIGLVDAFTAAEAERLKHEYADMKIRVHIWTNDGPRKRLEPDKEIDAYLWRADGTPR